MGGVERDTGTWGRLDEFNVDGSLPIKGMTIEEFPVAVSLLYVNQELS